ncbi:MAG: hypothetical protein AAGG51_28870 [Cyanobacteria bacterium P01_G01_bin.54]
MDSFYENTEYKEIVADATDDSLLDYGRPGAEFWGAALFIGLWLGTVIVVWAKRKPSTGGW